MNSEIQDTIERLHHNEIEDSQRHPGAKKRIKQAEAAPLLERELAKRVLRARDDYNPLYGFRHISQLEKIPGFDRATLDRLIKLFSPRFRGKWEVLYADAD